MSKQSFNSFCHYSILGGFIFTFLIHQWLVLNLNHLDEHIIRREVLFITLENKELRMIYPYFLLTNMC